MKDIKYQIAYKSLSRIQGPTPTENTGPNFDHSTGLPSGHYLYFEADQGPSAVGFFRSPDLQSPSGSCTVRFYYYLFGNNVGTLTVQSRGVVNGEVTWKAVRFFKISLCFTFSFFFFSSKPSKERGVSIGAEEVVRFIQTIKMASSNLSSM